MITEGGNIRSVESSPARSEQFGSLTWDHIVDYGITITLFIRRNCPTDLILESALYVSLIGSSSNASETQRGVTLKMGIQYRENTSPLC